MKNTPLFEKHTQLGAKMAPFAGYNMPISYSGINEEHLNVRNNVGVFDVSHMGEFIVKGRDALALVQSVTSNDAATLLPGQVQYSCMPNDTAGIVDDLLVYRLFDDQCAEGEQAFMLVVNASNLEKDWNWIRERNHFETRLINISDQTGLIAVQGPRAIEVLQTLTDTDLSTLKYYTFTKGVVAGIENVLISATGYTGAGGFELYVEAANTEALWEAIFEAGQPWGIKPAGLGARDTLRLEMGYCLYGNDIDDTTSPLEAGLGWITKLQKGDFSSQNLLQAQKMTGISRKLVGFMLEDRRVPRHGYTIENSEGELLGLVTSGTMSPSLGYPIGMGYVPVEYATPGTTVFIVAGGKRLAAKITRLPFVTK